MFAEVYPDNAGEWRWRTIAGNGVIVGAASEGFTQRGGCLNNLSLVSPHVNDIRYFSANPRTQKNKRRANYNKLLIS